MAAKKSKEVEDFSATRRQWVREGIASSFASGITANFLTPFLIAVNSSAFFIGLLNSIPVLVSALTHPLSAFLTNRIQSGKKTVLFFVFFHSLSLLSFALISAMLAYSVFDASFALLFFACVSAFFNSGVVSPLGSWIKLFVPGRVSVNYFAFRRKVTEVSVLISVLTAGILLSFFKNNLGIFIGFCTIFLLAFFMRAISLYHYSKMDESAIAKDLPNVNFRSKFNFSAQFFRTKFGGFALFVACMQFAVGITGGFFAVYYLKFLNFSYFEFAIATTCASLSAIFFFSYWAKIKKRLGYSNTMIVASILVCFVPLLIMFYPNFYFVLAVELFSGFAWAGFNLISYDFMLRLLPVKNSPTFTATYGTLVELGAFFGALLGGLIGGIIEHLSIPFGLPFVFVLFAISVCLRFIFALAFLPAVVSDRNFPFDLYPHFNYMVSVVPRGIRSEFQNDWKLIKLVPSRAVQEVSEIVGDISSKLNRNKNKTQSALASRRNSSIQKVIEIKKEKLK